MQLNQLLDKANKVYLKNFKPETCFERAIFLSWYCSKADCKFCYMSTQKNKIKNPKLARRKLNSILAEVYLCKKLGWKIEFLSGGYESYTKEEMLNLIKEVKKIYKDKLWLNMGVLNKEELEFYKPYIYGVTGAIETINNKLHKKLCPSKPIEPIIKMFLEADKLKLKKAITIIVGLGETEKDLPKLHSFIKKYKVNRVTFYALNPHKGTIFKQGPDTKYYVKWIASTRIKFSKLEIIAGTWYNRVDEVPLLLKAGANSITKFPVIKYFNSNEAREIESRAKKAGRTFNGTLTNLDTLKRLKIKNNISYDIYKYIKVMQRLKN